MYSTKYLILILATKKKKKNDLLNDPVIVKIRR